MLLAVRPYASPGHALITLPGAPGRLRPRGRRARGLRAHVPARRLPARGGARRRPAEPRRAGTRPASPPAPTPSSPERWVRPDEHGAGEGRGRVDRADPRPDPAVALGPASTPGVQERVVDYLAPVVGDDSYPRINWLWFRLVVETFLRSVGGPWSAEDIEDDLALHDVVRPRRRLVLRRRRARLRPLRRLGAAPVPGAVGADAGRGRRRPTAQAPRRSPRLDRFLQRRGPPGRRRRHPADPGPQPDLPLRRRGAVLGRRARRGAQRVARASCAGPRPSIVTHFVAARRAGRATAC